MHTQLPFDIMAGAQIPSPDDHEVSPIFEPGTLRPPTHRFYMVGKLIRQDLSDPEPGFRETLKCLCHEENVKVYGPLRTSPRYAAYCSESQELLAEATTMEELWSVVKHNGEIVTQAPTVT